MSKIQTMSQMDEIIQQENTCIEYSPFYAVNHDLHDCFNPRIHIEKIEIFIFQPRFNRGQEEIVDLVEIDRSNEFWFSQNQQFNDLKTIEFMIESITNVFVIDRIGELPIR